jgi:hypothetical protein
MPPTARTADVDRTAGRLRAGLIALATISTFGCAFELYTERHWASPVQLVAWAAVAALALAVVLALVPGRPTLLVARAVAAMVLGASAFGIVEHVLANLDSGVLDGRYSATWDQLSPLTQVRYAVTKTVGPAPPLAPGMLGQGALLLLLATIGRR